MGETPKIVSLASALAALTAPTAVPPISDAAHKADVSVSGEEETRVENETQARRPVQAELLSFIVQRSDDGSMFPQHGSHVSHSSHSSHSSHVSGYGGGGGGGWVPSAPDVPYVPPGYPPAVPAPVPSMPPASTSPVPAGGPDIVQFACTRASAGLGVNDIASELVQVFGITAGQAIGIADQALVAVLAGGHFCDGYLQ